MAYQFLGALLRFAGSAAMRTVSGARRVVKSSAPVRRTTSSKRGRARSSKGAAGQEIGPWRVNMNLGSRIASMDKNLTTPKYMLDAVGLILVAKSQEAFREQKYGGVAWKPRRVPNVFGIIADFSQGNTTKPPSRRFTDGPALFDKGALLKSLSYRIKGTDTVMAGSWLPYAGKHQVGGETESLPITEQVQKKLSKFLGRKTNSDLKAQLGWLLNKKFTNQRLRAKLPARPFVGMTKELQDEIIATIGAEMLSGRSPRKRGGGKP